MGNAHINDGLICRNYFCSDQNKRKINTISLGQIESLYSLGDSLIIQDKDNIIKIHKKELSKMM